MKKNVFKLLLPAILLMAFISCNDPIFYMISNEIEMVKPRIDGTPTNFVEFGGDIFVASGSTLHSYEGDNKWSLPNPVPPGGKILRLAVTENYFYAICEESNGSIVLKRTGNTESLTWNKVPETDSLKINSIFGVGNKLFFSTYNNDESYTIHCIDDDITSDITEIIKKEKDDISSSSSLVLRGVVFDGINYYICTNNEIFYTDDPTSPGANKISVLDKDNKEIILQFMGIINLKNTINTIVAITRDGKLFYVTPSGINANLAVTEFSDDRLSTGALAVWTDGTNHLLLVGRQDISYSTSSGFTYGYVEIDFDDSGIRNDPGFREPGIETISSVNDHTKYVNSIGKNPVNHIILAPDGILFASTQKNGVWSYRKRNEVYQWNAEE